jgi:hypothetical protein
MALFQPRHGPLAPRVVGRAGASLAHATWAVNADVAATGRDGELRTAAELHRLLLAGERGPTVLHDLMLPVRGVKANIDHVIVSGRDVWLLDTKVWAPGVYWTFRGHTRRGWSWKKLDYLDKKTAEMARRSITELLLAYKVRAVVHRTVLVVWPSSKSGKPNLAWYKPFGAQAMPADALSRFCRRLRKPASPDIVATLARLVVDRSLASVSVPVAAPDVPEDWLTDDIGPVAPDPDEWS